MDSVANLKSEELSRGGGGSLVLEWPFVLSSLSLSLGGLFATSCGFMRGLPGKDPKEREAQVERRKKKKKKKKNKRQ